MGINDIRVNNSGCLERCELGPTMVIYPEGVWYHYDTVEDINEILHSHIENGQFVDRLILDDGQKFPHPAEFSRLKLRVTSIDPVTLDTVRIAFKAADGEQLPSFTAGAHIDVVVAGGTMRCSYSLINDPAERYRYVIGVLRETESHGGSEWIHSELHVGDVVRAGYPINNFQLVEDAPRHVLIAGGIGVAPVLSMCYRLRELGANFKVYYCERSRDQAAFVDEIQAICGSRLTVHFDGGNPAQGINLKRALAGYSSGSQLYLCGPSGLMEDAQRAATEWPQDAVHLEGFHRRIPDDWKNSEFEVILARRDKKFVVPENRSILETLKEAGVTTDFSCEEGLCGACRTTVLHGKVEHRDLVLSERDRMENKLMMICISRAAAGETQLILDI